MTCATIQVSTVCNQRCFFCIKSVDSFEEKHIDISFFEKVVDKLVALGVRTVSLSGLGESLLHPQIDHIAKYIKDRGAYLIVYTNGKSAEKIPPRTLNRFDRIYVSVHGDTPEEYEKYTGNAFPKILSIVENLSNVYRGDLVLLNYPNNKLYPLFSKWARKNPTHPMHNWGSAKLEEKTGFKRRMCRFCVEGDTIFIGLDGYVGMCGNDIYHLNKYDEGVYDGCAYCDNYPVFLKLKETPEYDALFSKYLAMKEYIGGLSI